jgi:hypothetical protein
VFRVGDWVTGKPKNGYHITTDMALMRVTKVTPPDMRVKVIEHLSCSEFVDEGYGRGVYPVRSDRFVKVDRRKLKGKI